MKRVGLKFLYLMRQIFAGTPVQKWKFTTYVYAKLFHSMYGKKDVIVEYKGISLLMPTKDVTVVPSIIGGYFESLELDVFRDLANASNKIIDVGGNLGIYAIISSKYSDAFVYSFEPIQENILYFEKNIKLNKAKSIKLLKQAVGNEDGKIKIYLSDTNVGTHSAIKSVNGSENYEEVPVTTLDSFVKANKLKVDLLKVDVEGYDGFVYEGATEFIKRQQPTLLAEYAPVALRKAGYEPKKFLCNIVSMYEKCYLFDEKRNILTETNINDLRGMHHAGIENLLLVSNKKHIELIKKYLKKQ